MSDDKARPSVRVDLLGPLRLNIEDEVVDLPGPKRRALLALLAGAEDRTVPVDRLIDALWPDARRGFDGRQALHTNVARVRRHLGPWASLLETRPDGYRLLLGRHGVDVAHARSLLTSGRHQRERDPVRAYALLREAHALWRGPMLADLTDVDRIAAMVEEWRRLYTEVTDAMVGAAVEAGLADEVLSIAAAAADSDPLREPAVLLKMQVLASTGRAPEALAVARGFRQRLADETGLDPTPALNALERQIAGGSSAPAYSMPQTPLNPVNRLIGRDADVAGLHRLLAAERLVTLVGPGGVGKTRVAVEIASRNPEAKIVLLAPLTEASTIPHAFAEALDVKVDHGDVLAACAALIGDDPVLLIVDNCEHLLDQVRDTIAVLLSACPRLSILATSREPLGLTVEYTSRLAPLALPGPEHREPAQLPSVLLFIERARRVRPDVVLDAAAIGSVAEIVRRLDGIPLAIELAAGRLTSLSLIDLRDRLDHSLDLLSGGRPSSDTRHRTLRATVEWSYEMLTPDEQRVFRHLAVFPDGIDLDAAEKFTSDLGVASEPGSILGHLVDASMLNVEFGDSTRYRMLVTMRSFGLDRLDAHGELEGARSLLLRWALDLTSWIADTFSGEHEPRGDRALRREVANLRAAWRLARACPTADEAIAIITSIFDAVAYRDLVELRGWAEELADDPRLDGRAERVAVLGAAAEAAYHRGDHERAHDLATRGLTEATGDSSPWRCLLPLAVVGLAQGGYDDAARHALASADGMADPRESYGIAALATAYSGDLPQARTLNARGRARAISPTMRAWTAYVDGEIENRAGDLSAAERHYLDALALARASGATFVVGIATVGLLTVRSRAGDAREALSGYREVIDYFERTNNWTHQWVTLRNLADLLDRFGDVSNAAALRAAANHAPDGGPADQEAGDSPQPVLNRAGALTAARQAIDDHLTSR